MKHLKIDKKEDAGGVGIEQVAVAERDASNVWWHDAFAGRLTSLDIGGKKSKKSSKKKKEERDKGGGAALGEGAAPPSFDVLFAATGGARLGMRARRPQPGKLDRADHVAGGSSGFIPGKTKKEKKRAAAAAEGEGDGAAGGGASSDDGGGAGEAAAAVVLSPEEEKRRKKEAKKEAKRVAAAAEAGAAPVVKRPRTRSMDATEGAVAAGERHHTGSGEDDKRAKKKAKKAKREGKY